MKFLHPDTPLSEEQIERCELSIGLQLPKAVREQYLESNGGEPEPYVFQNDELDTVVSEFLPLVSETRGTSLKSYKSLVAEKRIVPTHFFPFAVDGGGDYFFVDTTSLNGSVYFYNSDSISEPLVPLGLDFVSFWNALIPE